MKKRIGKLRLSRETIRRLAESDTRNAAGASPIPESQIRTCWLSCTGAPCTDYACK